jgi:uncharacterized protein YdhG (YjbR/CyaY superfamily)
MAERRRAKKGSGFTADERAAMKERSRELKGAAGGKGDGEADVLARIAELGESDRKLAERVHALIRKTAPELEPRTWYGMPAYAKDGKVLCFFQAAGKFKSRYATLGFSDRASLDDGAIWPTSYAVTKLTASEERRIAELLQRAVG